MTTAASNPPGLPLVPEFDVVVLGRSLASRRAASRVRDEVRLEVHEISDATLVRYDDIAHRWEVVVGDTVVARAKFTIDGHGGVPLRGNTPDLPDSHSVTMHGFPNLFRTAVTLESDAVGYTVSCIEHMCTNNLDYVERRVCTPIADDDFPELSFDRPTPHMWFA